MDSVSPTENKYFEDVLTFLILFHPFNSSSSALHSKMLDCTELPYSDSMNIIILDGEEHLAMDTQIKVAGSI